MTSILNLAHLQTGSGLLFGMPETLYADPKIAASAFLAVPAMELGAELHAIRDAYVQIDPKSGQKFRRHLHDYKRALKEEDQKAAWTAQRSMAAIFRRTGRRHWEFLLEKLKKKGWPMRNGFLKTPASSKKHVISILELRMMEWDPQDYRLDPSRFSITDPIRISSLKTVEQKIASLFEPGADRDRIPWFVFEGPWPMDNLFLIDPKKIEAASKDYAKKAVALITVAPENRHIALYCHQNRFGLWELFCYSDYYDNPDGLWQWDHHAAFWEKWDLTGIDKEGGNRFIFANLNTELYFSGRFKRPIEVDPDYRKKIEKRMRKGTWIGERWKEVLQRHPLLFRWLSLPHSLVEIPVSLDALRCETDKGLNGATGALRNIWHLLDEKDPDEAEYKKRILSLLKSLRYGREKDFRELGLLLEEMHQNEYIDQHQMKVGFYQLTRAQKILRDQKKLEQGKNREMETVSLRLGLWRRDPWFDGLIGISDRAYEDLSNQVLLLYAPNGDMLDACALRLFEDEKENLYLFYDPLPFPYRHWRVENYEKTLLQCIRKIGKKCGIPEDRIREMQGVQDFNWLQGIGGLHPITASKEERAAALEKRKIWRHPLEGFLAEGQGTYEALNIFGSSRLVFCNPWLGDRIPIPNGFDGVPYELLPPENVGFPLSLKINPEPHLAGTQVVGYSIGTGRSIDLAVDFKDKDGVQWHHLSLVGVGKTHRARLGRLEFRDGQHSLDVAQRRFYLSNLMHFLGLRTARGMAVISAERPREGAFKNGALPQIQAILYELCREQLRLDDLSRAENPYRMIHHVKRKIAAELGLPRMSDAEYVRWLGHTLGEQFALMIFYGFDHGVFNGMSQLTAFNVSLAGEIRDFDAAGLTRDRNRLHDRYFHGKKSVYSTDLNLHAVLRMQQMLSRGPRNIPRATGKPWLHFLLDLAPYANFYDLFQTAMDRKRQELETSGIDPKAEIRRFNTEMWNPYMRQLRNSRLHGDDK